MTASKIELAVAPLDQERLRYLLETYNNAMAEEGPERFNDMLAWAYRRQGAQAELSRLVAKILAQWAPARALEDA